MASQYETRTAFWRGAPGCYTQVHRNGWANQVCAHMRWDTAKRVRWVYAIQSRRERIAYVGLTWNIEQRVRLHRTSKRPVATLLRGDHDVVVLSGPHSVLDASAAEARAVDEMVQKGWTLLNVAKPGALGFRRRFWTKSACAREAKKYARRGEFARLNHTAYSVASSQGWLDEICVHMVSHRKPDGFWTKERCADVASSCVSRAEFRRKHGIARQIAQRNGWMDEICAHMVLAKKPNGYWTLDRCQEESRKFESRSAFATGCPSAYDAAWRRGWLDLIFATRPMTQRESCVPYSRETRPGWESFGDEAGKFDEAAE